MNNQRISKNIYNRKYRQEHKEEISKSRKKYRQEHEEQEKEYDKKYYHENREKIKERKRKHYQENKERNNNQSRKYYYKHTEERNEYSRKYNKEHREELYKKLKNWKKQNPEKVNEYINDWREKNRIIVRLKNLLYKAFKRYTKTGKIHPSKEYGIDYQAIINHLKPFPENISQYNIHHKIPIFTFNLINEDGSTNLDEIKKAFAPENHKWVTIEEHKEIHKTLNPWNKGEILD